MLTSTFKNNKELKKNNPDELTLKKRALGEFNENDFVHCKGEGGAEGCND